MNYTYKKEKQFLLITCILSFLQGVFYVYDGIITGFTIGATLEHSIAEALGMEIIYEDSEN